MFNRGNRWWIAYYAPKGGRSVEIREPSGKPKRRRVDGFDSDCARSPSIRWGFGRFKASNKSA
jgi:hypothetical protein